MAHIKVEFTQLQEAGKTFSDISGKILQANKDFQTSLRRIDWEVKSKGNIESRARKLSQRLDACRAVLSRYGTFVNNAYSKYAELENYQNGLEGLGDVRAYSNASSTNTVISGNNEVKEELEKVENELDMITKVLKVIKKHLGLNIANGVLEDIIGLIVTVFKTAREGMNDFADILSFISKGGSGIIALISDMVDKGNVHGFAIIKTVLSMFDDFLDFQNKGIGKIFQDSGKFIYGIGKLAEEYLKYNIIQQIASEGFTRGAAKVAAKGMVENVSNGVIAPLVAFGSLCTRYVGDMIEFSKDGNYSIQDLARTFLDSGLAGVSGWVKFLTCGAISIDVDQTGNYITDACNSVHDYMEKNNWPTWAKIGGSILGAPVTFGIGLGNMFKGKVLTA